MGTTGLQRAAVGLVLTAALVVTVGLASAQEAGEVSLVSVWLSRMPPERAAEIQRKMTIKPDE